MPMARLGLLLALLALDAEAENVLRGLAAQQTGMKAITDGDATFDGEAWTAPEAVQLRPGAIVTWDLGQRFELEKVAIQADNNDAYVISASDDGKKWSVLWRAPPVDGSGLVTRSGLVRGSARYLELVPEGGDSRYSVSELEVFRAGGGTLGSVLLHGRWWPHNVLDLAWARWVGLVALALAFTSSRLRRIWVVLVLAGLLLVLFRGEVSHTFQGEPQTLRINWLRAMAALTAALAIGRELLDFRRWPASRLLTRSVLAISAGLALLCFANLGHPQFWDVGRGQQTWLHHYDLRTYYPIAKYFRQLRFDGVYAASAEAVAEDRGGLDAVATTSMRDLRTHEVTDVGRQKDLIAQVRARFTDDEWKAFRADAMYFRRGMGDGGFLGTMGDHGGNATPVWFLGARLVFGSGPASDAVMWRAVAADLFLLLLAFAALGVAFGWRTMLVAMVLFGAQDFYQFGTNWLGAPLRHDWLALWGMGLAALRLRWFWLAGGLLAWTAMIRAFPALTFVVLMAPAGWALLRSRLKSSRQTLREWARSQRSTWQVLGGGAVGVVVLFAASSLMFGPSAWLDWAHKVGMLDRDAHVNNLSVRTYVTELRVIWMPLAAAAVLALFFAVRRAPLETAAATGLMLVPLVFNPANYYLHCVCLLAVLAEEAKGSVSRLGATTWLLLLSMCVASWFTSLTHDLSHHFGADTGVLLVTLLLVFGLLLARSFLRDRARRVPEVSPPPAPVPPPLPAAQPS